MKRNTKIISMVLMFVMLIAVLGTAVRADDRYTRTKGSLQLTKYETGTNVDGAYQEKLAGVTFDIYKVADNETSTATPGTGKIATKTTGADGIVKFDDLALGRYLVVESDAPANVVQKIANFLVDIPMTNATGDGIVYDVELQPKNSTAYGGFTLVKQDENGNPLEGVIFKVQKKDGATWADYATQQTLGTNAQGAITLTGLPEGTYRMIETGLGNNDGYILDNETAYEFTVKLNTATGVTEVTPDQTTVTNQKPTVSKEITSITNSTTGRADGTNSANKGDTIKYTITAQVPNKTIARLNTYKVIDEMDNGLTFVEGTATAVGVKEDSTETAITPTVTKTAKGFEATFTNADLAAYKTIKITYDAKLGEGTTQPTTYNNKATLQYSNIVKTDYTGSTNTETTKTTENSTPVKTGGFKIEKRADTQTGKLLPGAEFKLALSIEDAGNQKFVKDSEGNEIVLTTDAQGATSYYGLAYGEYYLVETKAPVDSTGKYYNSLNKPQEFTINDTSYATPMTVINKSGTTLPGAGGIGAIIFIVIGVAAIGAGVILHIKNKRD